MSVVAATDSAIARAAKALKEGELVAFPTETVYGLGGDATNAHAVARIFELKGRPRFNPLIVHVSGMEEAQKFADFSDMALTLAEAFWPGELTLVLPKAPGCAIADLATAGLDTIALRIPAHPVAQALLEEAKVPVAAPSANRSGHVSPTCAAHVEADLGNGPAFILDGGPAPLGIESTVVDVTGDGSRLLRPGAVARTDIEAVMACPLASGEDTARPASPGMLASHYAPRARLRLDAKKAGEGEALLAFGPNVPATSGPVINLSETGDLREAAANLFAGLRELDATCADTIAVMAIPQEGLGEAINDRLRRGAAERGS